MSLTSTPSIPYSESCTPLPLGARPTTRSPRKSFPMAVGGRSSSSSGTARAIQAVNVFELGPGHSRYSPAYGYSRVARAMRSIRASTPSPRRSARSSGSLPNQRPSGARWWTTSALSLQRRRQPMTSYTVYAGAPPGLTATQVCTPK
jgi:hypothetical protein